MKARLLAPEAGRQGQVSFLVVDAGFRALASALAVDRRLVAQELHLVARVVAVEPDANAGGGVAVPSGVDQAHVGHSVVVSDGVDAVAVVAIWAVARAARARGKLRVGSDLRVANDFRLSFFVEGRRNVVLAGVGLGCPVDAGQVDVRRVGQGSDALGDRRAFRFPLLETNQSVSRFSSCSEKARVLSTQCSNGLSHQDTHLPRTSSR